MGDNVSELHRVESNSDRIETSLRLGRLVWRSWGTGAPLVLLHGGYGSWTHWLRNIGPFSSTHRVLVPDMPGFGESDALDQDASAFSIARAILDGLDVLIGGDKQFSLAGFSFGGSIAGHVASLAGLRVDRLVLVGSGGLRVPRPPPVDLSGWRHLEDTASIRAVHRANLAAFMIHDPDRVDSLAVEVQEMNARRARFKSRPVSRSGALHDRLLEITSPIGGIWGEQDVTALGYIDDRKEFLRSVDPEAEFVTIPRAGHWVQFEEADAFNEALAGMLARPRPHRISSFGLKPNARDPSEDH